MHVPISRIHLIGYLVEDGITSSVHAKHTFSSTSIMLRFAFCFRSRIILVCTPPLGTKGGWREGPDPPRVAAHCRMVYQVVYKHNNYNNYNMVPVSCKQAGLRIACFSRNILDFSCFLGDKKTRMDKKCKEAPGGVGGPPV